MYSLRTFYVSCLGELDMFLCMYFKEITSAIALRTKRPA